jgi:hypothetical protein
MQAANSTIGAKERQMIFLLNYTFLIEYSLQEFQKSTFIIRQLYNV